MTTLLIRTVLIYIFLIFTMQLMGKRQIGELEVTDLVTTLLLSEIAALPITNQEMPVSYAIVPMVILLTLEVLSSYILLRFPKLKMLLSAPPTVLIRHGQLNQKALRETRITIEELMHIVYSNGVYNAVGLQSVGKQQAWLDAQLKRRGLNVQQLFCVTATESGKLYWIGKEEDAP